MLGPVERDAFHAGQSSLVIVSPTYHELGMLTVLHHLVCRRQNLYVQRCVVSIIGEVSEMGRGMVEASHSPW